MAKLPEFNNEEENFEFFENHSGVDFTDEAMETKCPVKDRRPKKVITTIRIDPNLKENLKKIARYKGILYQTLINMWLTEKSREEIRRIKKSLKAEFTKDTGNDSSLKAESGGLLNSVIQDNLNDMKRTTSGTDFASLAETVGSLTSKPGVLKETKIFVLNDLERQEKGCTNFDTVKTLPVIVAKIGVSGDKDVKTRAYNLIIKWCDSWSNAESGKSIKDAVTMLFSNSGAEDSALASRATNDLIHTMDKTSNARYFVEMGEALGNVASSPCVSKETKISVLDALESEEESCSNVDTVKTLPVVAAKIGASGDKEVKTRAYNLINKWDDSWTNISTVKSIEDAKKLLFK
ncbi:MAG: BrnA antitoxin family protein [Candidatus Eremiobacteraeota bacterium]|nr:BrnA antitoxin family protein [Candidatus Eremiobacteraeota bacterium]